MNTTNIISLTSPNGKTVWVNCDKILYLDEDNSTEHTLCVLHLHDNINVMVKESIHHVSRVIKQCPH